LTKNGPLQKGLDEKRPITEDLHLTFGKLELADLAFGLQVRRGDIITASMAAGPLHRYWSGRFDQDAEISQRSRKGYLVEAAVSSPSASVPTPLNRRHVPSG
jgi:hypothetical protein